MTRETPCSLETQFFSKPTEEESIVVFKFIKLNPGITQKNFVCCMLYYLVMIYSVAIQGSLQPLILLDSHYYNIPKDQQGAVTSLVLVVQLIIKIIVSIPYGHSSDKFGRKTMIYYATANYLVGALMVPYQDSLPGFLLAKCIAANAASAYHCVPLLADYIADESKGKASAMAAMCFGFGALMANLTAKLLFYLKVSLGDCYIISGIIVFAVMIIITFGLRSGYENNKPQAQKKENNEGALGLLHHSREAIEVFKGNAWLRILLVLQILGSSDFMVFFTFMTIFVKSLFPEGSREEDQNIVVNNLQTLVIVPMILGNVVYGYLLDRKNKIIQTAIGALVGGGISFILFSASTYPTQFTLYIGAAMLGGTLPGLFVITSYLGIKNYPPEKRGIMIGFVGLIGYIGYFIIATGGGILYDHWRKDGPFLVCTVLLVVAIVLILKIYRGMVSEKKLDHHFQQFHAPV